MPEKILVTGGNGFIGTHLCSALLAHGHQVRSFSRSQSKCNSSQTTFEIESFVGDIRDSASIEKSLAGIGVIFHNAALIGKAQSPQRVKDFVETNVHGTSALISAIETSGQNVSKIILSSSASVYGEGCYDCAKCGRVRPKIRNNPDDYIANGDWNPPCPNCSGPVLPEWTGESEERYGESVYALSKKSQEDLLTAFCSKRKIQLLVLRYTSVFGAGQTKHNTYTKFIEMLRSGTTPQIAEDGYQTRDFLHVSDAISANLKALNYESKDNGVFNIGSSKQTALIKFANMLSSSVAMHSSKKVIPEVTNKLVGGEIRHCMANCSSASKDLHFQAEKDLNFAINELTEFEFSKKSNTII